MVNSGGGKSFSPEEGRSLPLKDEGCFTYSHNKGKKIFFGVGLLYIFTDTGSLDCPKRGT